MKAIYICAAILILFIIVQTVLAMSSQKTEQQAYRVVLEEKDFERQQERDAKKDILSKDNGITLIKIPSKYSHKKERQLAHFICCELLRTKMIVLHDTVEIKEEDEYKGAIKEAVHRESNDFFSKNNFN